MTREKAYEVLNEIFREVFDDETLTVGPATTAEDIEDWDSLEHITLISAVEREHINLVVAVEKKFGVKFNIGEVNGMNNVGEMIETILKRTGQGAEG